MPQKKASTAPKNEEQNQPEANEEERRSEAIYHSGSVTTEGGRHKIHCLTIIGQIEGHYILPPQNKTTKYEHVIPQLVAIEEDQSIRGLLVILNTVGGDVEAGLAIAELLSGMKTPTVSLVLGGDIPSCAVGRFHPVQLHRPHRHHDRPPRADERA